MFNKIKPKKSDHFTDDREWVQDHDDKTWHWYGCGQYAHAACGYPCITGTPLVYKAPPTYRCAIICSKCKSLYDLKHETN